MGEFNQAKYIQEFQKEKYDRCIFNVPKGQKAVIETHWKAKGYKSLNAYVNDLIDRDMKAEEKQNIHVQNSHGVVIGGSNNQGIVIGDIKGNVKM